MVKKVKKEKKVKKVKKVKKEKKEKKEKQIGEVSNYFDHIGVAALKLSAALKLGDKIHIKGGESTDFEQEVKSMQVLHDKVEKAKSGDEVGIKVKKKVRKGYKVFKV